jgi:hypothetical protein
MVLKIEYWVEPCTYSLLLHMKLAHSSVIIYKRVPDFFLSVQMRKRYYLMCHRNFSGGADICFVCEVAFGVFLFSNILNLC